MGATASANGNYENKDYENIEPGVYPARCIVVAELGTRDYENIKKQKIEKRKEILLGFEITGELMQDGQPFVVSWRGTNSLYEQAKLFKLLSAWRGKAFSQAELAHFEMKNVLDRLCMVNVIATVSKASGKTWAKVDSIMPLPKGMTCGERHNPLVDFGIGEILQGDWDKLWPWVQRAVLESDEGKEYQRIHGQVTLTSKKEAPPAEHDDNGHRDDVPF